MISRQARAVSPAEAAESLKNEGNALYKDKKYQLAVQKYQEAVGRLSNIDIDSRQDKAQLWTLMDACRLNMAQCFLNDRDYLRADDLCSVVLCRGPNYKAYFRRGTARMQLGRLERAEKDLIKAAKIESNDAYIKAALQKCRQMLDKQAKAKEMAALKAAKKAAEAKLAEAAAADAAAAAAAATTHASSVPSSDSPPSDFSNRFIGGSNSSDNGLQTLRQFSLHWHAACPFSLSHHVGIIPAGLTLASLLLVAVDIAQAPSWTPARPRTLCDTPRT